MKNKSLGYSLILILFVISTAISWSLYFRNYWQSDTVDISEFPDVIGDWTSEELPLSDYELAILETDNAFVRRYTNTVGDEVYLFIVYSQNNRKVSHPPEICYTGSGATIFKSQKDHLKTEGRDLEVVRFNVELAHFDQIIYYWFKVGDAYTSSYWKQQGLIAVKSLLGQPSSSALIRLSCTVKNDDEPQAVESIERFAQGILQYIPQYLP
jgi:EpsI family protein